MSEFVHIRDAVSMCRRVVHVLPPNFSTPVIPGKLSGLTTKVQLSVNAATMHLTYY